MAFWRRNQQQAQATTEAVAEVSAVRPAAPVKKAARAKMMRQYDLVDRVRAYNPNTDEDLLNRAYVYAMMAHG
ncbi:MAG: hypothetical protein V4661_09430, partial [Pseudomonadota bacterium]